MAERDVRPWRYPPRLDLQYGDWWRQEFEQGDVEPWTNPNPDLAIVLAAARAASLPILGPPAVDVLDTVPRADVVRASLDALPALLGDLADDTRNVVLTLARMWLTVATAEFRPKDVAADWAIERLPAEHRPVLARARAGYLGTGDESWDDLQPRLGPAVRAIVGAIESASGSMNPAAGKGHTGQEPATEGGS